jgi:hypothetical protein
VFGNGRYVSFGYYYNRIQIISAPQNLSSWENVPLPADAPFLMPTQSASYSVLFKPDTGFLAIPTYLASLSSSVPLFLSTDGLKWKAVYNPSQRLWSDITAVGNGLYASTTHDRKEVQVSTNGLNWSSSKTFKWPNFLITNLRFAGGKFFGFPYLNSTVFASADGLEWSPFLDFSTLSGIRGVVRQPQDVAYDGTSVWMFIVQTADSGYVRSS